LKERSGAGDEDKPNNGGLPEIRRGNGTKPNFDEEKDEPARTTISPETDKSTPTKFAEEEISTSSINTTPLTSTELTQTETKFSSVNTVVYDTATVPLTVNVDIIETTTDEPVTTNPAGPRPTFFIPPREGGYTLPVPCKGRKCKDRTRPTKSPKKTRRTRPTKVTKTSASPENTAPILIPTQTPEKVAEEDVIVPCNEGQKFKEHKCVNTTYDMPWRSQAEGKGLFFAKMFLYPDSEYDQPFAHPPVLGTNDTVFIGVQLMGGPPSTTLSVKRYLCDRVISYKDRSRVIPAYKRAGRESVIRPRAAASVANSNQKANLAPIPRLLSIVSFSFMSSDFNIIYFNAEF